MKSELVLYKKGKPEANKSHACRWQWVSSRSHHSEQKVKQSRRIQDIGEVLLDKSPRERIELYVWENWPIWYATEPKQWPLVWGDGLTPLKIPGFTSLSLWKSKEDSYYQFKRDRIEENAVIGLNGRGWPVSLRERQVKCSFSLLYTWPIKKDTSLLVSITIEKKHPLKGEPRRSRTNSRRTC